MSLRDSGKVMIEFGLNESVKKKQLASVTTTVPEVIDGVSACAAAGAPVVHYHARDGAGADIWKEVGFYRAVAVELMARHGLAPAAADDVIERIALPTR